MHHDAGGAIPVGVTIPPDVLPLVNYEDLEIALHGKLACENGPGKTSSNDQDSLHSCTNKYENGFPVPFGERWFSPLAAAMSNLQGM
jgi:hypothetical protein